MYSMGIDIEGTNTVFGIIDIKGNIVSRGSMKTGNYQYADQYTMHSTTTR